MVLKNRVTDTVNNPQLVFTSASAENGNISNVGHVPSSTTSTDGAYNSSVGFDNPGFTGDDHMQVRLRDVNDISTMCTVPCAEHSYRTRIIVAASCIIFIKC